MISVERKRTKRSGMPVLADVVRYRQVALGLIEMERSLQATLTLELIGVLLYSSSKNEHKSYYTYYSTSHSNGTPE
jgi:hypothetical protein